MSHNSHNFVKWFAEPTSYEKLKTATGLQICISIRGRKAAEPFAQIDTLCIAEFNAEELSDYELLLIELRDQANVGAGVIAHMVLRPDGKACEVIDHGEHTDYSDCGLTQLLVDTMSSKPVNLSDWISVAA